MLHLLSWETTLPILLIGMLGIFLVIGVILYAVAGGQRKQISAHDRMKNMFGDLDLDAMRQK